jgi:branched-chain amino acid transport system substrate-binding protein
MRNFVMPSLTAFVLAVGLVPAQAQVSDGVVKIGVINDQSGMYADITGPRSVAAVKMAVEDFGGTVLGKPIEVVVGDHQNKVDIAAAIAQKWIDVDHVDVITDATGSGVALALQEITRRTNRNLLVASAASSDLTGSKCSETGTQWAYDTYSLAKGTAREITRQGGDSWFFITADYAFGHAMERDATTFIEQSGGKVLGSVSPPQGTTDYASFVLRAQASKAKIVGLATASSDTINTVKQIGEFGLTAKGQKVGGLLVFINDIDALGLQAAQGLMLTTSFYWDMNDETRAWTKRFWAKAGDARPPNMDQAGIYAAVFHYLKAVQAAGTDEAKAVAKKMRELPVNDFYNKNVEVRADGRVMHKMYLMQVKSPAESKHKFDYYKPIKDIAPADAFRPLEEGGCPLIAKK